ncbi:hypothetical protein JRG66_08785 [Salinimicrobium tongyeongense]|jgi:hypothetical protein|uniref:Uncharacterized protein n=1 Tax=Salinimicrobium tongyeongense TaxID=2809707 RepID=A0ABY6NMK1_9FLAO|nr:hypothetical protein [Salinimicrobium tongyeongense]UZH54097.1 hypothetical protein JRG66_08785 [Salinimicrobium tongyeongense]
MTTTFVTQNEMRLLWKTSLERMIADCRASKKLPGGLLELIKHNLFAKYAAYNPQFDDIEIGVNECKHSTTSYADIRIYQFPLDELEERLTASFKTKRGDLEFYARVFKGKEFNDKILVL